MFENSLALVEDCGLTWLHVFPFSARPGTPAARMPAVLPAIVKERAVRLREAGQEAVQAFVRRELGAIREVLVERPGFGRTAQHAGVRLDTDAEPSGLVAVEIVGSEGGDLCGRVLRRTAA
jgi:threonylcarbamoyladenosine tRNA methylthiotransferase MtaB